MKPKRFPDPFALTTDPRSYVPRVASERALREMEDVLTEVGTAVLLAGPPGIGKTLMLHVLAERLEESFLPVYVPHGRLGAEDLAAFLLGTLGAPAAADPVAALVGLARSREQHRGEGGVRPLIALVDDVGGEGIEAVERFSADARALRLVAVPASDEDAGLLRRKLGDRATLVSLREPLSGAESSALVRRRLVHAGLPGSVIGRYDEAAIQELHAAAEGNPMALHALADEWLRRRARSARPKPRDVAPEPARPRLGPREIARATHPPRPAAPASPPGIQERPPVAPLPVKEVRPSVAPPPVQEVRPSVAPPPAKAERPAMGSPRVVEERPAVGGPPSEPAAPDLDAPPRPRPLRVLPAASAEAPQPNDAVVEPAAGAAAEAQPPHRVEATPRPAEAATPKASASVEPSVSRPSVEAKSPLRGPAAAPKPPASGARVPPEPPRSGASTGPGLPPVVPRARRRPFEPTIRVRPRGGAPAGRKPFAAFSAGLAAVVALALWLLVGGPSELPGPERSIDVAAPPPTAPVAEAPVPVRAVPEPPPATAAVAAPEPSAATAGVAAPEPSAPTAAVAAPKPSAPTAAVAAPKPSAPTAAVAAPEPSAPTAAVAAAEPSAPVQAGAAAEPPPSAVVSQPRADTVPVVRASMPAEREQAATSELPAAPPTGSSAPADELASVREADVDVGDVAAAPALIRVHINATPWAEIELDGRSIGLTPLGNVEMTAGEHGFRAVFGDGSVIDRTIEVGSDARRVTFDRAEAVAPAADDDSQL